MNIENIFARVRYRRTAVAKVKDGVIVKKEASRIQLRLLKWAGTFRLVTIAISTARF